MPISLEAARMVVRGAQQGLLWEAAALAAIVNTSPFPIKQPFGHDPSVYTRQYAPTGLALRDRASLLMANLAAYEFWCVWRRQRQGWRRWGWGVCVCGWGGWTGWVVLMLYVW